VQPQRNDVRSDLGDLRREVAVLRSELAAFRWEMTMQRYATRDDVFALVNDWHAAARSCIRRLVLVQAVTVVVMSTILFGLLRFT
jgi:hypothetical protein